MGVATARDVTITVDFAGLTPLRGLSIKGEHLQADAPFGKMAHPNLIAGLRCVAITAPFVIDGAMDGDKFDTYVRTHSHRSLSRATW